MQILKPKKSAESGMSMLIVVVVLLAVLGAMRYITQNMNQTNKANKDVGKALEDANHRRFVQQVIADDQLCKVTNFLEGIKGYSLTKPAAPITVKDTGNFVDYSGIGIKGLKWPSSEYETMRPATVPGTTNRITGKVKVTSVVFIQPADREVIKTEIRGKTYYRIPIDVAEKGTLNGTPTVFYDKREGMDEPIRTFIELNPDNFDEPIACYKDVSPRSLCLDAGGDYVAAATVNRCILPFQHPSMRVGGEHPGSGNGWQAPKSQNPNDNSKDNDNRWNWGGQGYGR